MEAKVTQTLAFAIWGWYWTLIFCYRISVDDVIHFLKPGQQTACVCVCDWGDRHVWLWPDEMIHIQPHVWVRLPLPLPLPLPLTPICVMSLVCFVSLLFHQFCQLMTFIEFSRGKKLAKNFALLMKQEQIATDRLEQRLVNPGGCYSSSRRPLRQSGLNHNTNIVIIIIINVCIYLHMYVCTRFS